MIDQNAERRRERLSSIIHHHFRSENDTVVKVIKEMTGQDVSVRSIQTWLIDPRRTSHRKVPEWVLSCLEDYVQRPERQEELKRIGARADRKISATQSPLEWADEVRSSKAVDIATHQVEAEARGRKRWCDLMGRAPGDAVHEAFLALDQHIQSVSKTLSSIKGALHTATTFEEFKALANDSMREVDLVSYFVSDARKALENNEGEFGNMEGLPSPTRSSAL